MSYPESYDDHQQYKRQEELREQYYQDRLRRHPDCTDPQHPGCVLCDDLPPVSKSNRIDPSEI